MLLPRVEVLMRSSLLLSLFAVTSLSGCGGGSRSHTVDLAGNHNEGDLAWQGGPTDDGGATDTCSEKAKLIYVVDENGKLSSFDPAALKFQDLGVMLCGNELAGSTNSMAIDRDATAW